MTTTLRKKHLPNIIQLIDNALSNPLQVIDEGQFLVNLLSLFSTLLEEKAELKEFELNFLQMSKKLVSNNRLDMTSEENLSLFLQLHVNL